MIKFPLRNIQKTGVIYVTDEAVKKGYDPNSAGNWANLGQGSPEKGHLEGAPERIRHIDIPLSALGYAPVLGIPELREAVANMYNQLYRRGMKSKYTVENVAIAPGGRPAVARALAVVDGNIGHYIPDYTAYEELMALMLGHLRPCQGYLSAEDGYVITPKERGKFIASNNLNATLESDSSNPTGQVLVADKLDEHVDVYRKENSIYVRDEFYSGYYYGDDERVMSAAGFVQDVNKDPVVIIDGLTKSFRYPGFRVAWIVAAKEIIDRIGSAGSFIDGGASHPLQHAAINLVNPSFVLQERASVTRVFKEKRDFMVQALRDLGMKLLDPISTFYLFPDISSLPETLNDGMKFFLEGLNYGLITVPGKFFCVDPGRNGHDHKARPTPYNNFSRISFGPEMSVLQRGVKSMTRMVKEHSQ